VVAFGEYGFVKITAFLVKRNLQIEENKTSGTYDGVCNFYIISYFIISVLEIVR